MTQCIVARRPYRNVWIMTSRETRLTALQEAMKTRVLVLDGAMGTMIQFHRPDEAT